MKTQLILTAASALLACPAWAQPTTNCGPAQFAEEPSIRNGVYTATLYSDCQISGATGKGMPDLETAQIRETSQAGTVHQGPVSETFLGLPSTFFDVTVTQSDPGGSGSIRSNVHIATDGKSRLLFSSVSTEVNLSGMAGYLRKIETQYEVKSGTSAGRYSFKLTNTITLAKPAAAPDFIFKPIAKKNALEQFTRKRDEVVAQTAQAL